MTEKEEEAMVQMREDIHQLYVCLTEILIAVENDFPDGWDDEIVIKIDAKMKRSRGNQ